MQNFEHFLVTHAEKIVQTQKILSLVVEDVLGPQLLARQFLGSFESGTLNCLKKSFIGQGRKKINSKNSLPLSIDHLEYKPLKCLGLRFTIFEDLLAGF